MSLTMCKAPFLLITLSTVFAGCAPHRSAPQRSGSPQPTHYYPDRDQKEAAYYWGQATFLALNHEPAGTPQSWSEWANDKSRSRQQRSMAATLLLGGFVRPKFTSEDMRKALPDPRWLSESQLESCGGAVGGRWPFLVKGSHFYLLLFPDAKDFRPWRIDFTLSGNESHRALSVQDARAFLAGTLPDKRIRIEELIMLYPLPGSPYGQVEELHNARGIGIKLLPGAWYD